MVGQADARNGLRVMSSKQSCSVSDFAVALNTYNNSCTVVGSSDVSKKCISSDTSLNHVLSFRLSHNRFGHPSMSKMKHIDSCIPVDNEFVCDTCHIAKTHRLPFPLSSSLCTHCFELLHVDLWGPYSIPSISREKYFLALLDGKRSIGELPLLV